MVSAQRSTDGLPLDAATAGEHRQVLMGGIRRVMTVKFGVEHREPLRPRAGDLGQDSAESPRGGAGP
jgi:hypothetical protein